MSNAINASKTQRRYGRTLVLAAAIMTMLLLAGCGSTKVYNNDKTVVYNGAIYNLSTVKQINSKSMGKLSDSNTVDLKGVTKKEFEAYLEEYNSVYVRMFFDLPFDTQAEILKSIGFNPASACLFESHAI